MRCHPLRALWLIPLVLLPLFIGPAYAGVIFGKRNRKPTPFERVPELLAQVKNDGDESKRAAAAQELRQYDTAQFPMIVPTLVDVLLTDKKASVRAEAAQSIGKMRPISQQAGMALEKAHNGDPSMRVRLQARSSLMQYHWNGYHGVRKDDLLSQTKEPPLADGAAPPIISTTTLPPQPGRLTPQPANGGRTTSGYRPAPYPVTPMRPTVNEPPLAPPIPPAQTPTRDGGPELSPP